MTLLEAFLFLFITCLLTAGSVLVAYELRGTAREIAGAITDKPPVTINVTGGTVEDYEPATTSPRAPGGSPWDAGGTFTHIPPGTHPVSKDTFKAPDQCPECKWSNTGLLNYSTTFGVPCWLCHGCAARIRERLIAERDEMRTGNDALRLKLDGLQNALGDARADNAALQREIDIANVTNKRLHADLANLRDTAPLTALKLRQGDFLASSVRGLLLHAGLVRTGGEAHARAAEGKVFIGTFVIIDVEQPPIQNMTGTDMIRQFELRCGDATCVVTVIP